MKNEFTIIPAHPNWFAIGNCAWEEIEPDSDVEKWGEPIIAWRIDKEGITAITTEGSDDMGILAYRHPNGKIYHCDGVFESLYKFARYMQKNGD